QGRWDALLGETRGTLDRLSGARPLGELRVVPVASGVASPVVGDGWLAAGDAAHTLDPLSSQGIVWALASGIEAAESLLAADPNRAASRYAESVALHYRDYLHTRRMFYSRERRWLGFPFWAR